MSFGKSNVSMEEIRVCAGCLVSEVRMFSLSSSGLLQSYLLLSGVQQNEMLDKLCWECAALVNKFCAFRTRCRKAHDLLTFMYMQDGQFCMHSANSKYLVFKRKELKLSSSLSVHHEEIISFIPTEEELFNHIENDQDVENCAVDGFEDEPNIKKEELEVEIQQDQYTTCGSLEVEHVRKELKRKTKKCKNVEAISGKSSRTNRTAGDTKIKVKSKRSKYEKPSSKSRKNQFDCSAFATKVLFSQEEQMEEMRKRQETSEYRTRPYKCVMCFRGFQLEKSYKNHMMKHDLLSGPYQCDLCKLRCKKRKALKNHINTHMIQYHCNFCKFVSQTTDQARYHYKWHTGVTYACEVCGEVFAKKSSHMTHLRLKHPSQHICPVCAEAFIGVKGLELHAIRVHKDVTGPATGPTCEPCQVRFVSTAVYHKHILISPKHEQDRNMLPNGCRDCGEVFASEDSLRDHARQHTREKNRWRDYPDACPECGIAIESGMQYYQHFRNEHPGVKYPSAANSAVCEYCGKSYQNNTSLAQHILVHTSAKQLECQYPECGKKFYNTTTLGAHMKTHSDRRPYECNICRKTFKVKQNLDRHSVVHTGEKPYKCDLCDKKFTQSSAVKLHVTTVHFKQPAPYKSKKRDRSKIQNTDRSHILLTSNTSDESSSF